MSEDAQEPASTSPLTWIALVVAGASIIYGPMLFGNWTSSLLIKLGLIRMIPIAAVVALIYGCSMASLEGKGGGKVSVPVAATIAVSGFGVIFDLACLFMALSHHGPGP